MNIERVLQTEHGMSAELIGLFASLNENGYLAVNGEVRAIGIGPQRDFSVVLTAYDQEERIVYTSEYRIFLAEFIGFEPFSFFTEVGAVVRVRLHLKPE